MPSRMVKECERYPELRRACPAKVPAVENATYQRAQASKEGEHLWVFFAEWNAPHQGITDKNAPPSFAHLNVFVGDIQTMADFSVEHAPDGDPPAERSSGLSFGERTWNGYTGELLLAPSYPNGGMEGDHLLFRWTQDGLDYSLSLHAWDPIQEAEATLKGIIGSLP